MDVQATIDQLLAGRIPTGMHVMETGVLKVPPMSLSGITSDLRMLVYISELVDN